MDYERRYKELVDKFGVLLNLETVKSSGILSVEDIRDLIPELAESEDERIRKELIEYIRKTTCAISNVHPATKEQRELLFQKMKEAGYEWDAEKKELKKCEDNTSEMVGILRTEYEKGRADVIAEMQNAWSEEDEKRIEAIIAFITTENNERGFIGQYGFTAGDLLHFLKSLKERYAWRPSEEQIAALTDAVNYWNKSGCYSSDLVQLLTDLKKLKD